MSIIHSSQKRGKKARRLMLFNNNPREVLCNVPGNKGAGVKRSIIGMGSVSGGNIVKKSTAKHKLSIQGLTII